MATKPLSDELAQQAALLFLKYRDKQRAADELGIPRTTFRSRLDRAAKRGLLGPVEALPGFHIKSVATKHGDSWVKQTHEPGEEFAVPDGHIVKGVSALLDGDERVIQKWVKTKEGERTPEQLAAIVKAMFEGWEPAAPTIPPPDGCLASQLTLFPLPDLHLGLYAWQGDAGGNWDLGKAVDRYTTAMAQVSACSPPSATAVVLGGGDYLHANTNEFRTQSGNVLDGDGRTDKVIDEAIRLAVFQIDLALRKHETVIVRFLKGNHDEYASIAIVHALAAWYRNEPRVTVDKDPSLFWWYRFGEVLLGASHGHTVKISDMPLIMANRVPKDWGETKHRFVHMFHVHHKTQHIFEGGGVIAESHQSPVVQDSYHHGKGYISGRSMQSVTYHMSRGEIVRNRVALD